jgi:hypothetical protein
MPAQMHLFFADLPRYTGISVAASVEVRTSTWVYYICNITDISSERARISLRRLILVNGTVNGTTISNN